MLDTEWWLRRSGPPESARKTVPCAFASEKSVLDSLKGVLRSTGDRHAILMSHHPVASAGEHGGFFSEETENYPLTSLKSWMRVPLPMIGSVYVAARRMGLSEQDLTSRRASETFRIPGTSAPTPTKTAQNRRLGGDCYRVGCRSCTCVDAETASGQALQHRADVERLPGAPAAGFLRID